MTVSVVVGAQWGDEGKGRVVEPVYVTWAGWGTNTSHCRRWEDLPWAAQAYLRRIEELAGALIRLVSVGPERSQMIVLQD